MTSEDTPSDSPDTLQAATATLFSTALEQVMREGVVRPLDALSKALDKESFAKLQVVEAMQDLESSG